MVFVGFFPFFAPFYLAWESIFSYGQPLRRLTLLQPGSSENGNGSCVSVFWPGGHQQTSSRRVPVATGTFIQSLLISFSLLTYTYTYMHTQGALLAAVAPPALSSLVEQIPTTRHHTHTPAGPDICTHTSRWSSIRASPHKPPKTLVGMSADMRNMSKTISMGGLGKIKSRDCFTCGARSL